MRIVVFANPRSGSGRGVALGDRAAADLRSEGVVVDRLNVGPGLPAIAAEEVMRGADAAVVAGGDGTVLSVAPWCVETGVPIYHLPAGNENLFSREFGMTADPRRLLWALQRRHVVSCDVGRCAWHEPNGSGAGTPSMFLLMASIGPDASVVHRLHASRKRAVGHSAYLGPILDELADPALSHVRLWCDGMKVVDARGLLVVANCRQYAFRMDPCPGARTDDQLLDFAFLPADTAVDALVGLIRLRVRCAGADVVRGRGRSIRVEVARGGRVQVDGEAAWTDGETRNARMLDLSVSNGFLPVLDAR